VTLPQPLPVPAFCKPATDFAPPADLTAPVVMIGPGTGGGAFVAFLQRRRQQLAQNPGVAAAPCWMVYGCRRRADDYLFQTEFEGLQRCVHRTPGRVARRGWRLMRRGEGDRLPRVV